MRIVAGRYRGLKLAEIGAGDLAAQLRPTTDRVRENLFNMLGHRVDWPGLRVLDLFAGTGALGIEALSRGAETAHFVENGRVALGLLRQNLKKARVEAGISAVDATTLPRCAGDPYDLILMDPPYGTGLGARALASAQAGGWIAPDALVVWEETSPQMAAGFQTLESRKYGKSVVSFLRAGVG